MQAAQDTDLTHNDLGPLAWVLDELRKSLESAASAMRRFVRDAALARGQDMASVDPGQLRIARQHMHQAVGALEMVGLPAPAHMLRSMEAAVQKFVERPELCTEAAAAKVDRAGFALAEYLEALLGGKAVSAVSLFVQYKDVQDLCGADRAHPADLWVLDWRWNDFPVPEAAQALAYETAVRARVDQAVLRIVKAADAAAGRELAGVSLGLAAGEEERQPRVFWKVAGGYFEAIALGLLPADLHVKRAASRVLMQYASLAKGEGAVSERLAQDLAFFCAQAVPADAAAAPVLSAVRQGLGLATARPVDYTQSPFGRFDPALLSQLRKRIAIAKETWSALSGGDGHKLKGVGDQFQAVADTLMKLYPGSQPLAKALGSAIQTVVRTAKAPRPELAMEVATAVLYLEAAFQDLDPNDAQLADRTVRLAERLGKVVQGGQPEPLEHWVEDLYRRVSDKQTMGSVVGELRGTMGELEKLLDQFFRNTADKGPLRDAPAFLAQMRGVLSVLGLDQAAQAVLRMRETVENIIATEVEEEKARTAGTFDRLGDNLGALGFLIDMLNYQPTLAKKLFVWDEAEGELRPLMGRAPEAGGASHHGTAAQVGSARAAAAPAGAPAGARLPPFDFSPAQGIAAAPAAARPAAAGDEDDDAELLDIFLEEAREVVQNGLAALEALAEDPKNLADLTTLRRAFHTLKGSSRMVGLNEFGEAAWSMEQVLNTWLADQKPAGDALRALSIDALQGFGRWIADIRARRSDAWQASAFRTAADALRTGSRLVAIELPAASPADLLQPEVEAADDAPVAAGSAGAAEADPGLAFTLETLEAFPVPEAPAAAQGVGAQDFGFTLDLADVHADAGTMPAPVSPEGSGPVAFDLSFEPSAEPEADRAPAAEAAELSPDELPPEFAELGATLVQPRGQQVTELDADELPSAFADLGATLVQPRGQQVTELSADELPSAFAELGATLIQPRNEASVPLAADAAGELEELASTAILPHMDLEPSAPVVETPLEIGGIDFSSLSAVSGPAAAPPAAAGRNQPERPVNDFMFELPADGDEPQPQVDAEPFAAIEATEVPAAEVADAAGRDEQVKVIGSLRIGIPLYNVYLNEADEWSRRLATEISEWTLEMNQRVPESTVGWAHALAGSSATVGFQALSEIARALEGALQHTQTLACGTAEHARTFTAAAEEVRRLLHQFAAGFLKEPEPGLLAALQELKDLEGEPRTDSPDSELPLSDFDDLDFVSPEGTAPPSGKPAVRAPIAGPAGLVPAASQARAPLVAIDDDEQLDVADAIDPDLFPIFEEEAAELMPSLGSGLRQWAARPDHRDPRDQVLRALHTLKGSARLAGALQLGELAHRMESEVEHLGSEHIAAADIEVLLQRFDAMQARFDTLRATGGLAPAEAAAMQEQQPTPAATVAAVAMAQAASQAQPAVQQAVQPARDAEDQAAQDLPREIATGAAQGAAAMTPTPARNAIAMPVQTSLAPARQAANQAVRVRSQLLDRLVSQAGEVMITRSRLESELRQLRGSLGDLTGNLDRLRSQLREIEVQAESQMQSRMAQARDTAAGFDPLEFDRFTRVQELTRLMAESVNDVATVQRNIQRAVEATEDDLIAQARQTRELQRDLLRTRMVEFDGISDRLYRVVRLAAKESAKQVKLDILGGSIEMDRGVLDRMTPAFEHLLRNCVAHGVEAPGARTAAGKDATGTIVVQVRQEGNDVSVEFHDDGAGLDIARIREKAVQQGLITPQQQITDGEAANLIFLPGFSTAQKVTELAGRGIGMDVVRSEVNALGGRIETSTQPGRGSSFKLVLPLTTAVTQVVMVRSGKLAIGVPANLVELVRRASLKEIQQAYNGGSFEYSGEQLPFFWSGALLQSSSRSMEPQGKTAPVVIFRSASQRVALHVDEVLGNQEVVVKNLGPQLSRLPGLAGMTVLASGAVVLIYNPVALTQVYGEQARQLSADHAQPEVLERAGKPAGPAPVPAAPAVPLVLVVDDSITVRRVTQRLLTREGYRVALAADGLQALERLGEELPSVVLSDIEMPRMDGFDLARNIRGDARLAHLPIVMITSRIAEKHREHAKELGVNHYLGKPYSEEELLSLVRHYCQAAVTA